MVFFGGLGGAPVPPICTCMYGVEQCSLHAPRPITLPQSVADEITMAAQYYAGSLVGHPFRSTQYGTAFKVKVDKLRAWSPRAILKDDCIFCQRTTNEDVHRRIDGFQAQIDIEVMRNKIGYLVAWVKDDVDVPEPRDTSSKKNRRRFIELRQDVKTEKRPQGWNMKAFPLVNMAMQYKRKLCYTWNHILLEWMTKEELHYDFEKREFYKEQPTKTASVPNPDP